MKPWPFLSNAAGCYLFKQISNRPTTCLWREFHWTAGCAGDGNMNVAECLSSHLPWCFKETSAFSVFVFIFFSSFLVALWNIPSVRLIITTKHDEISCGGLSTSKNIYVFIHPFRYFFGCSRLAPNYLRPSARLKIKRGGGLNPVAVHLISRAQLQLNLTGIVTGYQRMFLCIITIRCFLKIRDAKKKKKMAARLQVCY